MLVVLWFCLPARSVLRLDICAAMSLRKGFQLLAPRLGDQGARYLAAPLCCSAASIPLPSSDDRSPACSSCIPAFSRGRHLYVLILGTLGKCRLLMNRCKCRLLQQFCPGTNHVWTASHSARHEESHQHHRLRLKVLDNLILHLVYRC